MVSIGVCTDKNSISGKSDSVANMNNYDNVQINWILVLLSFSAWNKIQG
jgi:hypothetical protein